MKEIQKKMQEWRQSRKDEETGRVAKKRRVDLKGEIEKALSGIGKSTGFTVSEEALDELLKGVERTLLPSGRLRHPDGRRD